MANCSLYPLLIVLKTHSESVHFSQRLIFTVRRLTGQSLENGLRAPPSGARSQKAPPCSAHAYGIGCATELITPERSLTPSEKEAPNPQELVRLYFSMFLTAPSTRGLDATVCEHLFLLNRKMCLCDVNGGRCRIPNNEHSLSVSSWPAEQARTSSWSRTELG
ncbi:hypothetical protein XENOCAPTIV_002656 [Xenoophorus captivus]|uniref:Uncharacterized protein n=1 Tax=Xenoophorus captivus TaxID=1517983 RepID=A0ABV0QY30_9TELE